MAPPVYQLHLPELLEERLRVVSFVAREALSRCYELDIDVAVVDSSRELPKELIGHQATFVMNVGSEPRVFHGVISEVALEGVGQEAAATWLRYRVRLVPRLWLCTQRRRSRIFQRVTVRQVVAEVLAEARIPALWMLQQELPARDYITQYEETDEELVRRLMAEAGIFFFFIQPPLPPDEVGQVLAGAEAVLGGLGQASPIPSVTGEVMVFADDAAAYQGIGELPPALEQLIRTGLAELGKVTDGALGIAGQAFGLAAPVVEALGGPDLSSFMALGNSRSLHYRPHAGALVTPDRYSVSTFTVRDAVRTDHASFRVFDPRRPMSPVAFEEPPRGGVLGRLGIDVPEGVGQAVGAASALAGVVGGEVGAIGHALGEALGHHELERYEHHDPFLLPDWDFAATEPKRMLRSERRDQRLATASSDCALIGCGARFTLVEHPVDWVNREYAVVEVTHRGHSHDGRSEGEHRRVYENELRCVPSDVPFLPPRPPRRSVQTCLTATVIVASEDAHLYTRGMAEVKVRFHWDREERGTCWVRCMQAWSGAGWGSQFMPRVGMEVVVAFDGGDPDKPVVLGCVYNGTHPTPFALPDQQTRSGIRTQSTPGHGGANELSFEDRRGSEQVFLHAERDLDIEVEVDRTLHVGRNDTIRVDHEQRIHVTAAQHVHVDGGQHIVVKPDRHVEVDGVHEIVTRGDRKESVSGHATTIVQGGSSHSVSGGSTERVAGDVLRQASGSVVELVGSGEGSGMRQVRVEGKSQLSSASMNEIDSDEEVVLRVGSSSIRITKERIEIFAPEIRLTAEDAYAVLGGGKALIKASDKLTGIADQVLMKGSQGAMGLSSEASLDGSKVLLNSPQNASDSVESESPEPTVIELRDQDGNPLANERYLIELEDGSTVAGVLDEDGRAEIDLPSGGEVTFPDLPEVEPS